MGRGAEKFKGIDEVGFARAVGSDDEVEVAQGDGLRIRTEGQKIGRMDLLKQWHIGMLCLSE